jgi:protein-tyrosine phosphatase family protein
MVRRPVAQTRVRAADDSPLGLRKKGFKSVTGPMLTWPNCLNVRDLGGLPTSDGRQIGTGAFIRSDNLSRLTEAGVQAVRGLL